MSATSIASTNSYDNDMDKDLLKTLALKSEAANVQLRRLAETWIPNEGFAQGKAKAPESPIPKKLYKSQDDDSALNRKKLKKKLLTSEKGKNGDQASEKDKKEKLEDDDAESKTKSPHSIKPQKKGKDILRSYLGRKNITKSK